MDSASEPNFVRLESAIAAWNMKVAGSHDVLTNALHLTKQKLDTLLKVITERRNLSPTLTIARMKMEALQQTPEEREQACTELLGRLALLEETLGSFHLELQTLLAQAGRAAAAADVLAEELLKLHDSKEAAMLAVQAQHQEPREAEKIGVDGADMRKEAAALRLENRNLRESLQAERARHENEEQVSAMQEAEVDALRHELAHVRGQLREAQAREQTSAREAAAPDDGMKDAELQALRAELGHVREALDKARVQLAKPQREGSERERTLTARVEALRSELISVREQLRAAEDQAHAETRAAAAPLAQQEELAQLRVEVQELRRQDAQTPPDVAARLAQIHQSAVDAQGNRQPMGQILVEAGIITAEQLERALREQHSAWNRHLGAILVDLGYVTEEAVARALAAQIGAPFINLAEDAPDPRALALISGQLAHHHTCLPLNLEQERIFVAMANPFDLVAQEDLRLAAGRAVEPCVASAGEIKTALKKHYPQFVRI